MREEDRQNIQKLLEFLSSSISKKNKVGIEFSGALLSKYNQDGIDIYTMIPKEYEVYINEGLAMFLKRKKRHTIKTLIFSLLTAVSVFLLARFYLRVSLSASLITLVVVFLIDYVSKRRLNRIVFVTTARKKYINHIPGNILKIRESQEADKLWK